jgi:uncharacterized SAM-binding protein YcdF (DUF218 family)
VQAFVDHLKDGWRLTSPAPVLLMLVVGLVLLYRKRTARWGRRWLLAATIAYWLLATPLGAWLVSAPLVTGQTRIESRDQARGAQAVVVLGGGMLSYVSDDLGLDDLLLSGLRVIEGVRVYTLLGDPILIVSGGNTQHLTPPRPEAAALRTAAIELGVPASRIVVEDQSRTTREQALILKDLLARRHIDRFVLVTTANHMSRSLATFRAVGLDPVPSAAAVRGRDSEDSSALIPRREMLLISDGALYEYVAWVYYWGHGWLKRETR